MTFERSPRAKRNDGRLVERAEFYNCYDVFAAASKSDSIWSVRFVI